MLHEPEQSPRKIDPMKRDDKICIGSLVINIIFWVIAGSIAVSIGMGSDIPRYIMEFFFWIWILSVIPICASICIKALRIFGNPKQESKRQDVR